VIFGGTFFEKSGVFPDLLRKGWVSHDTPEIIHKFDVELTAKHTTDTSCEFADLACAEIPTDICSKSGKIGIHNVVKSFHSRGLFSEKPGLVSSVKHEIPTGDEQPYRAKPWPMTKAKRKVLDDIVKRLLDDDIIEPCESNRQSCPVLVTKPSKTNCAPN
jgi:hypothetical protein